jgi:hypothetical protein
MANENEIVLEDDWNYLAVTAPGGLSDNGAACVIEIGRHYLCPSDPDAILLPITADGAQNLAVVLVGFSIQPPS